MIQLHICPDGQMSGHKKNLRVVVSLLALTAIILTGSRSGQAIDAGPDPYIAWQPDGTPLSLRLKGDEWFHYEIDPKGFTVIREKGWYVFARREEATGHLVSTGLRAGIDNPATSGLTAGELPSHAARAELRRARSGLYHNDGTGSESHAESVSAVATAGTLKNLVVLIQWSDHTTRTVPSESDVDILMNNAGPHPTIAPTGSVRDVFLENSYGALLLESTVAAWVVSDNTEAYYANGNSGLTSLTHTALKDALNKVDNFIDFSQFDQDENGVIDSITFLHSGYGAEWGGQDAFGRNYVDRIWSHKWSISGGWTSQVGVTVNSYHISPAVWGTSGSNIGRIGVIAHETGHFLGLPDLYDTDSSPGNGIGSFGLMANSWGFDGSQQYPPHMSPWSKIQLGWLTPNTITAAGTYTLNEAEFSPEAYRIDLGYPSGEYLLIENRQPTGFDGSMPQGGLAIWHIDESAGFNTEGYPTSSGWTGSHYRVALLQADGNYNLEKGNNRGDAGDTWHGAGVSELVPSQDPQAGPFPNTDAYQGNVFVQTGNRIFNISNSGATMSFSFEVEGTPSDPPAAPTNLVAQSDSYNSILLSWSDNYTDESNFSVERSEDGVNFSTVANLNADSVIYTDTGLEPLTTYTYRMLAYNLAGNSPYSNLAVATTAPPPPPPAAPTGLAAQDISDSTVTLTWQDNASDEDAYSIHRSGDGGTTWTEVAVLPANSVNHVDTGLSPSTDYVYVVSAFNEWGQGDSSALGITTLAAPAFVDNLADLDIHVNGQVTGDFTATHESDNILQQIQETESGGKPSRRRSFLEHRWRFSNVRGGLTITLFINAGVPLNPENDHFQFESSTDGGSTWTPLVVIPSGTENGTWFSAELQSSDPSSTTYVRVIDTDSTEGNRSLHSLFVSLCAASVPLNRTSLQQLRKFLKRAPSV